MSCEFCDLADQGKHDILYSTIHWTVFLSRHQLYLGRSVVGLKRHAESISDLTTAEWLDLHELIRHVESTYRTALGATMFNWTGKLSRRAKDPRRPVGLSHTT